MDYSDIMKERDNITEFEKIEYEDSDLVFIKDELWKNNVLRQGWGIKNSELKISGLKISTTNWIGKYILSAKRHWVTDISCEQAKGRHNILKRMLDIKENDILLIPKTSKENINDYHKFVACEVAETYYLDLPKKPKDFGHCIKVKNVKEFSFNNSNLWRSDFGSPYICAVLEVKGHHGKHSKFLKFVNREY